MNSVKVLVLGGGGLAGIGWFAGLLYGLGECDVDLRDADRMIGTSAGSATAAQLRSTQTLASLYATQTEPDLIPEEAPLDMAAIAAVMAVFPKLQAMTDRAEQLRAVGEMALNAQTIAPEVRRAAIERRLSEHDWPWAALTITAVDAENGTLAAFDAASGVSLVDAVSASCAVPGISPVVAIGGRHYMDGGVYSVDNAHLAAGAERVLIMSPFGSVSPAPAGFHLNDAVVELEAAGSKVLVIEPDGEARLAMGANPLDPAVRTPSAKAGYAQGQRLAVQVGEFWGASQ